MATSNSATDAATKQPEAGHFATTHWSVVLRAGQADSVQANTALATLCETYWYPLYVYVRRKGYDSHDAKDLTQEFFARLLERKGFALADQSRGRFRSFLLSSLQHFLVNEWARRKTIKHGGAQRIISFDEAEAETRYQAEPTDERSPDRVFEKRWAASLLEQALADLRAEYTAAGRRELFETLKVVVWGEKNAASYQEMGAQLGMTEGAVKVAVHRLRRRYRERLREHVAQTVAATDDIDEEIRYLISTMSS